MLRSDSCLVSHFCDQVAGIWDHASAAADQPLSDRVISCHYMWQHLKMWHWPPTSCAVGFCRALPQVTVQDSMWPARRSPAKTIKVVVIDTQRVLDQWWGWHIPWQARYYSSATVPQIVFQVLGSSWVTLKAFMSLVRVGPSVCHQLSLPAEQEEQGHTVTWTWSLLDERSVKRWKLTAKRCLTKLELLVSCLFF